MTLKPLLTMVLLTLAAASPAQDAPVDLRGCFSNALAQSEALASRQEDIRQAEEHYKQAWGAVMPNLGLNYSYLHQDDHAYTFSAGSPQDAQTLKLSVGQPLFRGFREFQAITQLKATIAALGAARRWASMQLYQDLAQAYFQVLALEKDRDLVRDQVKLYDERIQDLKNRRSIGRSRDSEVLTVQAAQALLQASSAQLDSQIAVAREILAFLTGKAPEQALAGQEPLPAAAGDLAGYLKDAQGRPDLASAAQRIRAAEKGLEIAKGGHWPTADLLGNWYLARPGSLKEVDWDLGVVATLPLFQGFTVPSKTREAESQLHQAELDLQRQQRQVSDDVRSAHAQLSGDLAQVAALELAYDLSEKSYQSLKRDYNLGLSTNLDVLQALTSSRDAQRSLERARQATRNDLERLEAAAGRRLNLIGEE